MKILFVCSHGVGEGSFAGYVASTTKALAARGHEVHVLSCKPGAPREDKKKDGVWIHRRRYVRIRGLGRLSKLPVLRQVFAALRPPDDPPWSSPLTRVRVAVSNYVEYRRLGIDFDVIQSPEHLAETLLFAVFRTKPLVIRLCGPIRIAARYWGFGSRWHLRLSDAMERLTARRATLCTAPSQFAADELVKEGWRGARGAHVLHPSVEPEMWSGLPPVSETGPVILAVGQVSLWKGSDVLVKAASRLSKDFPGMEVVFAGGTIKQADGTTGRERIAGLANDLGVTCRFVDKMAREELPRYYGTARVVALPGRFDCFPKVGLEALVSGRPYVCSTRTGQAELAHRSNGAIVATPADDPDALAEALRPLLTDSERAEELGKRGQEFVNRNLAPEVSAALHEKTYKEVSEIWRAQQRNGQKHGTERSLRRAPHAITVGLLSLLILLLMSLLDLL
jgi:glycosyltransferase involved in cell wall biosynthesis